MKSLPRVALFLESSGIYGRGVLQGIARYIRGHRPWDLHVLLNTGEDAAPLMGWRGDGLISRLRSPSARAMAKSFEGCRVLFDYERRPENPQIASISHGLDGAAVMAFEDFRRRGYQHLAFVPYLDHRAGHALDKPFLRVCEERGVPCHFYSPDDPELAMAKPAVQQQHLARWLAALPRPAAVWCASDLRGLDVTAACRLANLRVPEDIAVLGHNNDELVCEVSNPPLSSIAVPYIRMGYEAAALLDRMMNGEPAPVQEEVFEPTGIVVRQSTDIIAVEDADLADAIRFIRVHATEGISVDDVVNELCISRSTLQRRFRQVLGRSPVEEIDRVRIDRAKELLAFTPLPMTIVAQRCGYSNSPRLAEAFRRNTGLSPSAYRRQHNRLPRPGSV